MLAGCEPLSHRGGPTSRKVPVPLGKRVQRSGERLGRSGLGEACPHGGEGAEASLEFVRLVGVAGPDARFELVEALRFTLDELLAFLVGPAAQLSQEGLTGVARPLEAEGPGDGGEGAPLFASGPWRRGRCCAAAHPAGRHLGPPWTATRNPRRAGRVGRG